MGSLVWVLLAWWPWGATGRPQKTSHSQEEAEGTGSGVLDPLCVSRAAKVSSPGPGLLRGALGTTAHFQTL